MTLWELLGHFDNEDCSQLVDISCFDKNDVLTFSEVVSEHSAKEVEDFEVTKWSYDFKHQVLDVELQGYWDAEKRAKVVKVSDIKTWPESKIVKVTEAYYNDYLDEGYDSRYIGFYKTDTGLTIKYTDDDDYPLEHHLDDDEIIDINKLWIKED